MPVTVEQPNSDSTVTQTDEYDIQHIGIELEYPVAQGEVPAGDGGRSRNLRDEYGRGTDWLAEDFPDGSGGYMGSDHTGAEITSGVLDLHSDEPSAWYRASIEEAENAGHPFAATGQGATNFGLHQHVSQFPTDYLEPIADACGNEWARVFFCSSVNEYSLDPWRHGGVMSPSSPWRNSQGTREQEFRLPEPVLPDHFDLFVEWWRLIESDGPEAAIDFARERVYDRDERLTAIQQYQQLDANDNLPPIGGRGDRGNYETDQHVAEWFVDLME